MGGACSAYGEGRAIRGFWWGNLRERNNLEDLDLYGGIILKLMFNK